MPQFLLSNIRERKKGKKKKKEPPLRIKVKESASWMLENVAQHKQAKRDPTDMQCREDRRHVCVQKMGEKPERKEKRKIAKNTRSCRPTREAVTIKAEEFLRTVLDDEEPLSAESCVCV